MKVNECVNGMFPNLRRRLPLFYKWNVGFHSAFRGQLLRLGRQLSPLADMPSFSSRLTLWYDGPKSPIGT